MFQNKVKLLLFRFNLHQIKCHSHIKCQKSSRNRFKHRQYRRNHLNHSNFSRMNLSRNQPKILIN